MKLLVMIFFLSGIISILSSKSRKRYQKLVEENDKEFADKNVRTLRKCGYGLLILSSLYFLFIFFSRG